MTDNFEFQLVGGDKPFKGYVSALDKTVISPDTMIRGSVNVYKTISGTIANRFGLLRRGAADATVGGVRSAFVWNTSLGKVLPLRVTAAGNLQVEYNLVWYTLLSGLTLLDFIFDTWFDGTEQKDRLIMANRDINIKTWSGGITIVTGAYNAVTITYGGSVMSFSISTTGANIDVSSVTNIVLKANPGNGDTITMTINGTAVGIQFVSVIGATAGNVLIGANVGATTMNLLGLLQHPGTSNANQVAFSSPNQTLIGYSTYASSFVLVKGGSTTWAQDGFYSHYSEDLNLIINGVTYAYTGGVNSGVLTGVTPDPTGISFPALAIQAVTLEPTVGISGFFTIDFLKTIGNQVYVGSYISRLIFISSSSDFRLYTVPTPRAPGDPEELTLDNQGKGISVRLGQPHIFAGDADLYIISFTDTSFGTGSGGTTSPVTVEETQVDKKNLGGLCAPIAHEFIDVVGDDIVYLGQDQQLRVVGTFTDIFGTKYPSLSQDVQKEFTDENFTGGHLKAIGDFIYITAPIGGRDWMLQTRQETDKGGGIIFERFWQPPHLRNISRIVSISGVVFGHSYINPQIYQIWDTNQWHDDSPSNQEISYASIMRLAYDHIEEKGGVRRQGLAFFDKVYHEGYIWDGSLLYGNVYFDYQGASKIQPTIINTIKHPVRLFFNQSDPSLGINQIGGFPLGVGLVPDPSLQEMMKKFRRIVGVIPVNCFEYSLEVYSVDVDARWEISSIGANATLSTESAGFLLRDAVV